MNQPKIYSIGYGNRSIEDFIGLLKRYAIQVVCDVRSTPYSARYPDFTREKLQARLRKEGLNYLFLGDTLGARPSDAELYEGGKASYKAMATSSAFRQGLERLEIGAEKFCVAIMCAEKDPLDCHRAVLISPQLINDGAQVVHIDSDGDLERHENLELRLLKRYKLLQNSFLEPKSPEDALAEAYEKRGEELAYDIDSAYKARAKS